MKCRKATKSSFRKLSDRRGPSAGRCDLAGITDIDFRRFDLDYPDSEAPSRYAAKLGDPGFQWRKTSYGKSNARSRYTEWKREFI